MNFRFEEISKEYAQSQVTIKSQTGEMTQGSQQWVTCTQVESIKWNKTRSNGIESQCEPEKKDENLLNIVSKLGNVTD